MSTPSTSKLPARPQHVKGSSIWPTSPCSTSDNQLPTARRPEPSSVMADPCGRLGTAANGAQRMNTSSPSAPCCRTLKGDDDRKLVNPAVVKDIVIGLSDGLTVPFGLTAGLAATGNSKVVVIGGVAELISGALSMAVGGYLSAQAERDHFRYLRMSISKRVKRSCSYELQREVSGVLGSVGIDETICQGIANDLIKAEPSNSNPPLKRHSRIWQRVALPCLWITRSSSPNWMTPDNQDTEVEKASRRTAVKHRGAKTSGDVGMTAFLLKFGEGEEEVPNSRLLISAFTIGISYAIGGIIPLFPYFFVKQVHIALYISIGITALTLLGFGIIKAYYTGSKIGLLGYSKSAIATLTIGAMAAGAAYGISRAIESKYSE